MECQLLNLYISYIIALEALPSTEKHIKVHYDKLPLNLDLVKGTFS